MKSEVLVSHGPPFLAESCVLSEVPNNKVTTLAKPSDALRKAIENIITSAQSRPTTADAVSQQVADLYTAISALVPEQQNAVDDVLYGSESVYSWRCERHTNEIDRTFELSKDKATNALADLHIRAYGTATQLFKDIDSEGRQNFRFRSPDKVLQKCLMSWS